jgi:ADP-heptose:LPS heptosyltransferase
MNILFVTSNRIGDAVLSTGLLNHLHDRWPEARITVACGPLAAPLFEAAPGVVRVLAMAKARRAGHWRQLWLSAVTTRWDVVVDLRGSALAWLLWAKRRYVLSPAKGLVHRVRHIASVMGVDPPPPPGITVSAAVRAQAERLVPSGLPVLAVGPTANWPGKQWPGDRFVAAIDALTGPGGILEGARIAVFAGPDEIDAARAVTQSLPADRCIDLAGRVDLPIAFACLARAALYIGNDSGLMHLAAASGTPTLGLFGPSREELYAPWGPNCATIRTDLSYDAITRAATYDYRRPDCHMTTLPVDKVVAAAEDLWRRTQRPAV